MSDWIICGIYFLGIATGAFGHALIQSTHPYNPRPMPDVAAWEKGYDAGFEEGNRLANAQLRKVSREELENE